MVYNIWKFKVFISINGVCDFEKWLKEQIPEDRAKIDIFIDRLLVTESWSKKHVRPLTSYSKINELVIKGKKIQLRPLGCFGPKRKEFTILLGAEERGDHFVPKDAPVRAERRQKLVVTDGERYTKDYE
jgi:hypothetical protein